MAASKYKGSLKKKLNSELHVVISSLRKDNIYLKKTLAELFRQHSQHNKLVERFLSLESLRLEGCQQLTAKEEKTASSSVRVCKSEGNPMDTENENIKNKPDPTSEEEPSTSDAVMTLLQNQLRDALEKNKQWLEYDQRREAYVRAVLARMLWLEKQLNEANQTSSQQHNEDHSDVEIQQYCQTLLLKNNEHVEQLSEEVELTKHKMKITENVCEEMKREVEELKQLLQTEERISERYDEDEEQQLEDDTKDLEGRLDEAKRRSANFELQSNLFQRIMVNRYHRDQENIEDLKRQVSISSQDLEDERKNCSYLKKKMVRVLKTVQKAKHHVTGQSKRKTQNEREEMCLSSQPSRESLASSAHSSVLNESILECPSCQAEYPASHYQELMNHLEICLD